MAQAPRQRRCQAVDGRSRSRECGDAPDRPAGLRIDGADRRACEGVARSRSSSAERPEHADDDDRRPAARPRASAARGWCRRRHVREVGLRQLDRRRHRSRHLRGADGARATGRRPNRIAPGTIVSGTTRPPRAARERALRDGRPQPSRTSRPARLERGAQHVGPAVGLAPQRLRRRPRPLGATTRARSARRRRSSRRARRARARAPRAPPTAGTGARGAAGGGGRAGRARRGPSRRAPGRASSSAPWATLKTASAIGTSARAARRAPPRCGPARAARRATASSPAGGSKRAACAVGADRRRPPRSAAATLSGWPSISVACASRSASSSKSVVGGEQAGDDRRGARAEPAGERDRRARSGT